MSKRKAVLSCAMAALLAGCFSGTIKESVEKNELLFSQQGVTLHYQTFYQHLPGNDWANYQYRHVARNGSANPVCIHLDLVRQGETAPFYTTHVNLLPGQGKEMSSYAWREQMADGGRFYSKPRLEGAACTETFGWVTR